MPAVRSLWSYGETGYHCLAAAIVAERYKREAMARAFRILGEGQLALTKFLLLTDRDVDLRDFRATLQHVLERARFETDLYVFANLSMDTLDYTGPTVNEGSKGVLLGLGDPVRELPRGSRPRRPRPVSGTPWCSVPAVCASTARATPTSRPRRTRLAGSPAFDDWPLVVLVDDAAARRGEQHQLPVDDLHALRAGRRPPRARDAHRPPPTGPHAADRPRRAHQAELSRRELFCDPDTASKVDRRWREYFPDGGVQMGDSDRAHLD